MQKKCWPILFNSKRYKRKQNRITKKTVLKVLQNMLFKVLQFIFAVLGRKTQNYNSKITKNEFANFVNIGKFQNTTTSVYDFDSLYSILFKIQQNRG